MVVADGLRRPALVLHLTVKVVEVLGRQSDQGHLAEAGPDDLVDLGPVGPDRGRGELQPLGLFQPLVEQLTECGPHPVRSALAVLVHEVTERLISRP